jgi:hypothetical protein
MKEAHSLDGIISYLTKKHRGNVHEKGIVTITTKSFWADDPDLLPLADLTSKAAFHSKKEPGQWICWDLHEMRVRSTNYTMYTIRGLYLKSVIADGWVDGRSWTEFDRRTDNSG